MKFDQLYYDSVSRQGKLLQNMKNKGDIMIKIENITKSYGNKKVLNNLSFSVKKGEPFAIIGRNGAGKSTTIKIILGLLKADTGNVGIEEKLKVGYLPEDRGLFSESTVYEHLKLFGKLSHVDNLAAEITRTIDRFELTKYAKTPVKKLSKGNGQKLLLAVTFLGSPNLIILDEPLSGLDPINKNLLKKIISEEKDNSYILLSSHQMEFVEEICSDAMFLKNGESVESGNIQELKRKYGTPSIVLPYNEEYISQLDEVMHLATKKGNSLVLRCDEKREDLFSFIMNKIPDITYINYQYGDIDDMYLQLLGKGDETK